MIIPKASLSHLQLDQSTNSTFLLELHMSCSYFQHAAVCGPCYRAHANLHTARRGIREPQDEASWCGRFIAIHHSHLDDGAEVALFDLHPRNLV
eukprot:4455680-Pleurochrysis_carterae.AAC.2